jgi:signal transduction histidine kinase
VAPQALAEQVGAVRTHAPDGRDTVTGFAPVPRTEWSLIVEENWADLVRPIQGYGQFLLLLLALGILVPTIVVVFGVRRITGPVNDFITAAKRIASGDFNASISVHTGDELEELARQFNEMAVQLHDSYATLEKRVTERTKELSAVNSIAEVVSRSLNLDQILPDALRETMEVLKMDGGLIFRLDIETLVLTPIAQLGMQEPLLSLVASLPLASSATHIVARTRHPVALWVSDYPPGEVRTALEEVGAKMIVSVPLLAQENVLGAINMYRCISQMPTGEELSVAAAVGQQIGVAMENARLYAQTVEYARSMEVARQAAEQASASKSDFVANVSHELRTPLTSILGFTRIVQKRLEERVFPQAIGNDPRLARAMQQVRDNLDIILSEGERLTTLINNILDLERIEAGKMIWRMEPLSLHRVIDQAAAATTALFEGAGLKMILDAPSVLPQVTGDRDKLVQVVINLVSNAAKFTPQGRVTIRACLAGNGSPNGAHPGEVMVSVSDTGVGIAPEDLPKIFEKFQQVGNTLTDKPKGTGLGLTICKQIVEHHGGRIWVESILGQGSTFFFTLPIREE